MRLTHKIKENSYSIELNDPKTESEAKKQLMDNFTKCCNKLGKLEDLEEQIGIPLEFILKEIIGKNIYYLHESNYVDCVDFEVATGLGRERDPFSAELGDWKIETDSCYTFKTSEYKKTWWLSEKEAQKRLEEVKK